MQPHDNRALPEKRSVSSSSPTPTLLQGLNPEQRAAVVLPAQHALILAGAGSGKTRVLTTRIAWLLQQGMVGPAGVLAVTFTNKAAREMLTRLGAMLPLNARAMWIGTFHGLCNRLLRAHHQAAALPATFQILDTQDQLSAIKRLYKVHGIDDERFPPREQQWFIAGSKEEGMRPKDVPVHDAISRRRVEIYQLYEDQCQREGVVDFAELLLRSYELLRDHGALRAHYQQRFRHILIDEFQDTNRLQYAWIKQLAGHEDSLVDAGASVFAVGDDDQSIYAFRGARVGNMSDFVREFDVTEPIKLEQNYRSVSNILDAANELISHNRKRLGKNLRTERGAGDPVRVFEAPTDFDEAQWIVQEIRQLLDTGLARQQVALLYRANAQSRVLETALFNAGIPYKVYGGLRFFERAEVKHALAYLRLLENPRDDTSFLRVVNFPPRGIGLRSLEQLQLAAHAAQEGRGCPLVDAVTLLGGKAGSNLGAFVAGLQVLREQVQGLGLRQTVQAVLDHSGLLTHYRNERDGAERVENLEELLNAAEAFVTVEHFGQDADALTPPVTELDTGETLSPLAAFLSHASLEAGDNQASEGQDAVQLMTVHAAKGLEFDCVFISGLEEGLFPHENALVDHGGLEEERRLMYVAITRARQRLYLSLSQTRMLHGQTRYHLRSRFLDELPESALQWITARPASGRTSNAMFSVAASAGATGLGRSWESYTAPRALSTLASPSSSGGASHGLRVGLKVFHNKFGEGTVRALEGSGNDARAQIDFPRHGVKWLALSVAKLTPIP